MYSLTSLCLVILVFAQGANVLEDTTSETYDFDQCFNSTETNPMCISLVIDTTAILSLQNAQNVGTNNVTLLSVESLDGFPISEYSITEPSISLSLPQDEYVVIFSGVLTTESCTVDGLVYSPCLESAFVGISAVQWEHEHFIYKGPAKSNIPFTVFYEVTSFIANHQIWRYNAGSTYSASWLMPSFDDSAWSSSSSFPLSDSTYLFLRTTFTLQNSQTNEAVELQYRVATPFALFLNGISIFSNIQQQSHESSDIWSTSTFPATFLLEGVNTVAVCISSPSSQSNPFDITLRVLPSTTFQSYSTAFTTDSSFSNLFDGNLATQWEADVSSQVTILLSLQFPLRSVPVVNDLCLSTDSSSALPSEIEVTVIAGTVIQGRVTLSANDPSRTETTAVTGVHSFCWQIPLTSYSTAMHMTLRGSGHIHMRELRFATRNYRWSTESFSYPLVNNTLYRPYEVTCFQPTMLEGSAVEAWSLFTKDYHPLPLSSGVAVNGTTGELCFESVDESLDSFVVSGFEDKGYKDVVITILEPPDCVDETGQTNHHGEEKQEGECLSGYSGYTYRLCSYGTFSDIQYDHCTLNPPSDLHYEVASSYYVNEVISLSPSVTGEVNSFSSDPSLPDGLTLNESKGIISGSASKPSEDSYTITATNSAGSTSVVVQMAFVYPNCTANDFYPVASVGTSVELDCSNWGLLGKRVVRCEVNGNRVEWSVVSDKCYNLVLIIVIIVAVCIIIAGAVLCCVFSMLRKWSHGSVKVTDVYV